MSKITLEDVNQRLKAGKVGVKVQQRGDRLSLRVRNCNLIPGQNYPLLLLIG
ncbi:hypothetical protein [Scytonema sp. PCC 10023]|uniref:hypothetical protein n=1 Tax=Scytonema sp. PCC 10023 TaxID=1680591 RepID=UPI0039C5B411